MEVKPSLKAVLKRLKLSGLVPVLPDRAAYARKAALHPLDFLELALQDEIDRQEHKNLSNRLGRAGHRVLFLRSDHLLKMFHQSRVVIDGPSYRSRQRPGQTADQLASKREGSAMNVSSL